METKPKTNGKAVPGTEAIEEKKKAEPAQPQATNGQEKAPAAVSGVESKIKRATLLSELVKKHRVLNAHLEKVTSLQFDEFDVEESGTEVQKITIACGNSYKDNYEIKNGYLCSKIVELLKREIGGKVVETEAEIETYLN